MSALDAANDNPICAAIDAAEEVRDPLRPRRRTAADAGAAFAPNVSNAAALSGTTRRLRGAAGPTEEADAGDGA
jgi:hypothetical protein